MSEVFQIQADYHPTGDQPKAIEFLCNNLDSKIRNQILLGITGSGKTFTMASIISRLQRPALVLAHNKTLAAQLYNEFQQFFPENAVEYFVSFYDYYQPEAYVPQRDLFIEKDTALNDELDRLRLSATRSILERKDVVIVSSVSCIYGLGDPEEYGQMLLYLRQGDRYRRGQLLERLVEIRYERNDYDFHRGTFRVRGDVIEIYMAEAEYAVRVELWGDEIENISKFEPLTGKRIAGLRHFVIYPASHYVTGSDTIPTTIDMIREELQERLEELHSKGKLVEYHRLKQRTEHDIEMIEETGFCQGIENYSRIIQRRPPGSAPTTLLDYLPENAIIFVDESHVSLPQVRGMYMGDRSRKTTLVEHGFRLPSAIDNRPLTFEEFEKIDLPFIYVSATPGDYELQKAGPQVAELVIRPTGLVDPPIEIRPVIGQVDDMLEEIRIRVEKEERVLITTLTKRMAEDLTDYYKDLGVRVVYMHSGVDAVERTQILHDLRIGKYDVLVGINLLREGLDLPEVSLVGIFDADKEGFLRSTRSLIQTCGRAARNVHGQVLMYADRITRSMQETIDITEARRTRQIAFNEKNGIIPRTVKRFVAPSLRAEMAEEEVVEEAAPVYQNHSKIEDKINELEADMRTAASNLEFEFAAKLRDQIQKLKLSIGTTD
ncbi:MAG: excinuclease ABC subunit B [Deltaproteobacteria bacterium]|nr:excinuclease ABC subunit B [Deltaproteobacteria bacterium]